MRKPYGKLILVLAAMALATGGCQKKGNAVETNASTEVTVLRRGNRSRKRHGAGLCRPISYWKQIMKSDRSS